MTYNLRRLMVELDIWLSHRPQIHLRELAEKLAVERHTIERAVREVAGTSFREYQKREVLKQALRLLTEGGGHSEKQIAFMLGYQSPDAFSRFIKAATGKTPTEIRRGGPFLKT
jgi:AraC-like DNA-binding protein